MHEPSWSEVDGVPVAWLDLHGPLRATLCFRVGIANETVPMAGITHLVEHLALYGMNDRPYSYNGAVGLAKASFTAEGRPEEVAEFLGTVCGRLGALPAERVAVERNVLRAESASRSPAYRNALLTARYGPQAHGLVGVDEYGLSWLDENAVRWWAAQRFTRQNAVLLLTGPPPPGLRLPLPDGPVQPPVVAPPPPGYLPAWDAIPAQGMAMGGIAPRGADATAAVSAVDHELSRILRFERGITYGVATDVDQLDAATLHVTFSADAPAERHGELRDAFLGIVDGFAQYGVPAPVLDRLRDADERAQPVAVALSYLAEIGSDFVLGRPFEPFAARAGELRSVTREGLHAAARAVADSAIFLVAEPLELPPRFRRLGPATRQVVAGDTHHGPRGTLVVGPQGVSRAGNADSLTVRWSDTVATLWWADGGRLVLGRDGYRITVVPADWEDGAAAVARIDQYAPRETMVPMQGAGPAPLPRPEPVAAPAAAPTPRLPAASKPPPTALSWIANGLVYLFAVLLLATAADGSRPATPTSPEVTANDAAFTSLAGGVLLIAAICWTVVLVRRRQAYR